ncbi:MAG: 4-carboxymuconolactone decarboxylase [Alphaproteobacteria bacterium]|jgi:4-carboxymuconolactone decarboxylase
MDEKERFEAGLEVRRAVLGNAHVDRSLAGRDSFTSEFQDLITRYAWGEIWTRPGLDRKTRSFLVLAMTASMGRWEEFRLHCRASFSNGVTTDDIKEVILQIAVYAGVPAANTAVKEAREVFAELGIKT